MQFNLALTTLLGVTVSASNLYARDIYYEGYQAGLAARGELDDFQLDARDLEYDDFELDARDLELELYARGLDKVAIDAARGVYNGLQRVSDAQNAAALQRAHNSMPSLAQRLGSSGHSSSSSSSSSSYHPPSLPSYERMQTPSRPSVLDHLPKAGSVASRVQFARGS